MNWIKFCDLWTVMARHREVSPESEPSSCSYTSASDGSPNCSTTASPQSPRAFDKELPPGPPPSFSPPISRPTQRSQPRNPSTASKDPEDIRIELCDVDLWRTFNTNVSNEMVTTCCTLIRFSNNKIIKSFTMISTLFYPCFNRYWSNLLFLILSFDWPLISSINWFFPLSVIREVP